MPLSARPPFSSLSAAFHRPCTSGVYPCAAVALVSSQRNAVPTRRAHLQLRLSRSPEAVRLYSTHGLSHSSVVGEEALREVTAHRTTPMSAQTLLRQRALDVGLIASIDEPTAGRLGVAPLSRSARMSPVRPDASAPPPSVGGAHSASSPEARLSQDPLLEFLEKNEEDAAALLAMWTSLSRACLYASEVSESLTLRVRYFLHRLIHQRAIAAAWELYERLVYLGVQLRHSDLALLLTSLPYEHSAKDERDLHTWMHEDAAALKDRKARSRRQQEINEESARWRRKAEQASPQRAEPTAEQPHAPVSSPHGAAALKSTHAVASEDHHGPKLTEASTPVTETAVEPHVLANQPAWVKRWLLYEASMGNFNLYEGSDGLEGQPLTPAPSSSATTTTAPTLETDAAQQIWEGVPDEAQARHRDAGQQAVRTLELVTRIEHLRILQLAPPRMQRSYRALSGNAGASRRWRVRASASKPKNTGSKRRRSNAVDAYWRDALDCTRDLYTTDKLSSMPTELRVGLRAIVLGSRSWSAALSYCQLLTSFSVPLEAADATLFIHLCADALPWKTSTKIETFVEDVVLPCLPPRGPVRNAALVLWLAHLCGVKSTRPDDFVVRLDRADSLFALPESLTQHGDVSGLINAMVDASGSGVRALHKETRAYEKRRRADDALAASVRSGLFRSETSEPQSTHVTHPTCPGGVTTDAPKADEPSPRSDTLDAISTFDLSCETSALLSVELIAALRTLCMSTKEALWVAALGASPRQRASVVRLHQLLEDTVYGHKSVWALYERLYRRGGANTHVTEVARMAPERAYVSCVVSHFLCDVLIVVCRQYSKTRGGFGAKQTTTITSPTQVVLFLDMLEQALQQVTSRGSAELHLVWAAPFQQELASLCRAWPTVLRNLFAYLGLVTSSSADERLLFGAVTPTTTECLARAGRLTLAINALTQHTKRAVSCATDEDRFGELPYRTRKILRACFAKPTTLGKKVRQHLNRKELMQLDALLFPSRRRGVVRGTFTHYAPPPRVLEGSHVTMAVPDRGIRSTGSSKRLDTAELAALMALRQTTHELLFRLSNDKTQLNDALCARLATSNWAEALQLLHVLTDDLRVAPHTLRTPFFQSVLAAMTRTVPDATTTDTEAPRWPSSQRSPAAANTVRGSLWLDAIGVFWKAVDHTAHASESAGARTAQADEQHRRHRPERAVTHERDVLGKLLVPMIEFSQAVQRRDLGRDWYTAWSRSYSRDERRETDFRYRSTEALMCLGDAHSLAQSAQLVADESAKPPTDVEADLNDARHSELLHYSDPLTRSQQLLCHVASRQHQWLKALDVVTTNFGSMDARETATVPYPSLVAASLLSVLSKCPTNLSNTGLRLHQLQCAAAAEAPHDQTWSPACAVTLCEMLLKARRWKRALELVEEALGLPSMQAIGADGPAEQSPLSCCQYGTLLCLGLQACAIGGLGDKAAELYTQFQALESAARLVTQTQDDAEPTGAASPSPDENAQLTGGIADRALTVCRHVNELSPRARSFYFRAMTKKMFPKPSPDAPSAADEAHE